MLDRISEFIFSKEVYRFLVAANVGWCLYGMRQAFATSSEAWWTICISVVGLFVLNNLMILLYVLALFAVLNILRVFAWGIKRVLA